MARGRNRHDVISLPDMRRAERAAEAKGRRRSDGGRNAPRGHNTIAGTQDRSRSISALAARLFKSTTACLAWPCVACSARCLASQLCRPINHGFMVFQQARRACYSCSFVLRSCVLIHHI